ncbi:hypothetical protein SU69_00375 [Thermosipho melanesiensis]|uniref:Uncharacterized protein n=3 Tax=Thermosipho melanesiensis TaxID=46541 RepID=A6LJ45_THEM4|nr:hypothetical protein [Thermosipho melanesiensis]ABR29946.1 hypothetical protein Tmel_0069 [Thermosipho melanesiensis BI429]APT74794.1 hypothetical protein BW47_00390 [Thermosipho melanesiensis]OOC38548.1 hypothetical protein SU68_00375 [Thermosipho melanesiensis]OOC40352.1 hypothetical protein SU70_00375 [Thermosipho melanesiensis]OOC40616.1 hypothetical protein SU69_00375 [Thermosipho melanesiensis]
MKFINRKLLIIFIMFIGIISIFKVIYPFIQDRDKNLIFQNINLIKDNIISDKCAFFGDNKNSISAFNKIVDKIDNDNSIKFVVNTMELVVEQ